MAGPAFRGASTHSLDDKSRLIVPKRILDRLPAAEASFVLTASPDGCLVLVAAGAFLEIASRIGGTILDAEPGPRGLRRLILGHAEDVQPDKAGRILISEVLRAYMGLGLQREVVVVGAGDWVELWAPDRWARAMTPAAVSSLSASQVEPVAG